MIQAMIGKDVVIMKVRECIKTFRRNNCCYQNTIVCVNGTKIHLPDCCTSYGWRSECMSRLKFDKDKNFVAAKQVYCRITPSKRTIGYDDIQNNKRWSLYCESEYGYSPFDKNEFVIPERWINHFISINGGVDEYYTFGADEIIYHDMLAMMKEVM